MSQVEKEKTKKTKTPSFVVEIPLKTDSKQMSILNARLDAGRQLYNAVLGEAKTRLELVRNSELYKEARKIPKANKNPEMKLLRLQEWHIGTASTICITLLI